MEFNQEILESDLPGRCIIISNNNEKIELRNDINEYEQCNEWVQSFSFKTSTQWIMRDSKPNESTKLKCK